MSKFCTNCGAEIENEEQAFCVKCGSVLPEAASQFASYSAAPINEKMNTMALTGFVVSLVSLFLNILLVPSILGLVFSISGLKQIKVTNEKGKGFATAGLVISIVSLAFAVIALFFVFVFGMVYSYNLDLY